MRKQISLLSLSVGTGLILIQSVFLIRAGSTTEGTRKTATDSPARLSDRVTVRAVAPGDPLISLGGGHDLITSYVGSPQTQLVLEQNLAQPAALASADFDEDGTNDLISGYAGATGGIVTLHRGNADAIYASSAAAKRRRAEGLFVESPFLSPARVFELPEKPELLATGDFDADGHGDVATVARSSNSLYLLAGDGKGGFASPTKFELPGRVTALVSGDINRADGLADLAIAVVGRDGAQVVVFEGPEGALRSKAEAYSLPAPAAGLVTAELTEDHWIDLAVAAGREVLIVEGRDRKLSLDQTEQAKVAPATIVHQRLPFSPVSISVGNFTGGGGQELALPTGDGTLHLLRRLPASSLVNASGAVTWKSEAFAAGSWSSAAKVIGARVSTSGVDDLLIADPTRDRLNVVVKNSAHSPRHFAPRGRRGRLAAALEAEGRWTAVLPMRLNGDALSDLVILRANQVAPAVVVTPYSTFTVTSPNDAGSGTLREAIDFANVNPGPDLIDFNILPAGPQTISLLSALTPIIDPVTIDGTTQPGFNGTPIIELNGSGLPAGTDGLFITAGNSRVTGLVINRFPGTGDGIEIQANGGNVVEGNFIGTDITGTAALPNGGNGIFINGSPSNRIGGASKGPSPNVISGNGRAGVAISGVNANGNFVGGNFIGTDASGTAALGNVVGVDVQLLAVTTIGGTVSGVRNIISGNTTFGIGLGNSSGNIVQGNFIGTDITGSVALGNSQMGVQATTASANNTFGGTAPGARNLVSANGMHGFQIRQTGTDGNLIQGNLIGTQIDGTTPLPNQGLGVLIENTANNNSVGGTASSAGNVISFNAGSGVTVVGGTGNAILGNAIFASEALGIDLGFDGVTPNDPGDGDTGANNLQNFPVLTAANSGAGGTAISGNLNSTPLTSFRIEFFSNLACDAMGNGEGEVFVGSTSVTTDVTGDAPINTTIPLIVPGGRILTATATGPGGDTSEFSACIAVAGSSTSADIALTKSGAPDPVVAGNSITYSITVTNSGPDDGTSIVLTDSVPVNTTFQAIASPPGWTCTTPAVGGTGAVNCTNPNLASAEMANFSFEVQVTPATSGGTVITNTASASSAVPDVNPANNSASTTTLVAGSPTCTLTCPPNIIVSASSTECGVLVKYSDTGGTCGDVSCSPPSNSFFAVGTTSVKCNAPAGPSCSFTVRVVDNTPPLVFCPTNIVQPVDPGQQTAVVSYPLPSTTDNCPGRVTTCTPPSGATFPLGATPVSCRVTDAANNVSSCNFTVTVNDNQPPTIACPANVVFTPQPGQCSPAVNYPAPTVSDNLPGATVACAPPSGSAFPIGTATITCTAVDVAGNRASCSFTVTVGGGLPQARITIPGGKTIVEFGNPTPVPARRKPLKPKNVPCATFSIENVGSSPLVLLLNGIVRTGSDVTGGRITDPDDSKIFGLKIVNPDQTQTPFHPEAVLIIQPCQARTFCATFNPSIPAAAGKTTGLSADDVLPDTVTSAIVFQQEGAGEVAVNLVGHVTTELLLINADNPRKQPRVEFTRSGNEFVVTTSIFDSNLDVRSARYEFLDGGGRTVDQPFDVDLVQPLRDLNLVKGQSFVIEQRFSGAASHPEVASVRVTVTDGQTSVSATGQLGNQSAAAAALVSFSRFGGVVLRLPGIKLDNVNP
jgi:uncharacterized repeat protein (TIGR01451 family)